MTKTIERPAIKLRTLPEIDDVTRRQFLIGAAGLLLLPSGCDGTGLLATNAVLDDIEKHLLEEG